MKYMSKLTGVALLVLIATALVCSSAWCVYTPLVVEIFSKTDDSCSGTNPFYIHTWMGAETTGDTYGGIKSLGVLPDEYQIKFKLVIEPNPLDASGFYSDGSPEPVLGVFTSNMAVPTTSADMSAKTKLAFRGLRDSLVISYQSIDGGDSVYYLNEWSGEWQQETYPVNVETLYDFSAYTRYIEFIKDSTNYTVNYYDESDVLIKSATIAIDNVFGGSLGDMFVGGDIITHDNAMKGSIEYMGDVFPIGTYVDLDQGWNMVTCQNAAGIAAADIYFSNDGGATLKTPAEAEALGWVQGTLYFYDDANKIYNLVPGDASSLVWDKAYWAYAQQSGITLVMLW